MKNKQDTEDVIKGLEHCLMVASAIMLFTLIVILAIKLL